MKTKEQIQNDVRNELNRESAMVGTDIRIIVNGNHITLEGIADSYAKKIETERAAMRVDGVTGVTNNIVLKISHQKSDEDIRKTVIRMITWNSCIDESRIDVKVSQGWVTLAGEVDYDYQKSKATFLTEDITGVAGVTNFISVVSSFEKAGGKLTA
ncbi:MAG: BON domain-containing protein [Bacteroidetes bacterium]|nr:BON domain-containing protein [Bacteroidota bacterium]